MPCIHTHRRYEAGCYQEMWKRMESQYLSETQEAPKTLKEKLAAVKKRFAEVRQRRYDNPAEFKVLWYCPLRLSKVDLCVLCVLAGPDELCIQEHSRC